MLKFLLRVFIDVDLWSYLFNQIVVKLSKSTFIIEIKYKSCIYFVHKMIEKWLHLMLTFNNIWDWHVTPNG